MTRNIEPKHLLLGTNCQDDMGWWRQAPLLISEIANGSPERGALACYRFGDAILELDSSDSRILDGLRQLYPECAVPDSYADRGMRVGCSVRSIGTGSLNLVTFHVLQPPDSINLALGLLENHHAGFIQEESPVSGWRLIRNVASPSNPLMATCGAYSLIDRLQEPPEFLVNYVVSAVLSLQRNLLFVHAGSIGIHGAGILLVGRTGAGKTTVSLTLASRGHAFLGDEVAALRVESCEILPFRRAAKIRPGPCVSGLDELVKNNSYQSEPLADGMLRNWVEVGKILPAATGRPVILRNAFFLRSFADRPAVEPFTPSLQEFELLKLLSYENTVGASWGFTPGQRLMKFLILLSLLTKVRCYLLDVGPPEQTADLIEKTTERLWV
jgi:hypothetical protein